MAANASDYLETSIINHFLRNSSVTAPSAHYVALFTTDPTDAGTGTEVSGNNYSRTAVTFAAPSGGATSNSAAVEFPVASGSWGTITHLGVYDDPTAGNLLVHGPLNSSIAISSGEQFRIAIGDLDVTAT